MAAEVRAIVDPLHPVHGDVTGYVKLFHHHVANLTAVHFRWSIDYWISFQQYYASTDCMAVLLSKPTFRVTLEFMAIGIRSFVCGYKFFVCSLFLPFQNAVALSKYSALNI